MQISFARTPQLTWHQPQPLAALLRPPRQPRRAEGLSGRPSCRIYRGKQAWVLEFDFSGGWIEPARVTGDDDRRLTCPTLAPAIAYAERHGLDYRIVLPPARHQMASNGKKATTLPRSWLAPVAQCT